MGRQLEEIEGIYRGERYRNGDFVIGSIELVNGSRQAIKSLEGYLAIKGEADAEELTNGGRYRFYGRFTTHTNPRTRISEPQFDFQTLVVAHAHDRDGIVSYLKIAGQGNGLGEKTALRLWEKFGTDAVRIVRETPDVLMQFGRITAQQAEEIGRVLVSKKATEDATIELTSLLAGRGFPKTTARSAIKLWKNKAAEVVRKNPYSLMNLRGCGFKLCDALWIELGLPADSLKRQALCAWHAIKSQSDGHTWFPVELAIQGIRENIGSVKARPVAAIKMAIRLGRMWPNHYAGLAGIKTDPSTGAISETGTQGWLAERKRADAERDLALMIGDAIADRHHWPDPKDIDGVDDHQRDKFGDSLVSQVAIFGGGPGTGKTHSTAMLARMALRSGFAGPQDIAIGAPTGKAAVRLTEALHAAGVNLRARTWHSLLGVGFGDGFLHDESNPWQFKLIIGDEESMKDTALMRAVFAARPRGCHVLLVGDVHQLPPVGAGAPLRDLIASKCIGYGELTEIKRNSGGIVEACAAIREGRPWGPGDNLIIDEAGSPTSQMDRALHHIAEAKRAGFDPVWDCQVIVAVNARSPLSRKIVNERLQDELNPNPVIKGSPFRLDDKIVCTTNGKYTAIDSDNDDDQIYVANGELAKVVSVDEKSIVASLSSPERLIRIPRGKSTGGDEASSGCNWELAYGMTCHKLQGSEVANCIVLIDEYPGAKMVCSREWLYTGISRAKVKCIVLGKKSTADAMCRRVAIGQRKTFLRELVQLEVANNQMRRMF